MNFKTGFEISEVTIYKVLLKIVTFAGQLQRYFFLSLRLSLFFFFWKVAEVEEKKKF